MIPERLKLRFVFLFGMLMAGIAAYWVAALLVRLGLLDETTVQAVMTVTFFVVLIGGAWAYDRGFFGKPKNGTR